MDLNGKEILLTINLEGGLTNIVRETKDGRKTIKVNSHAQQKTKLSEEFVKFSASMESKPNVRQDFQAVAGWKKMKPEVRIEYHIRRLVMDILKIRKPFLNDHYSWEYI